MINTSDKQQSDQASHCTKSSSAEVCSPYAFYVFIWLALLLLTQLTVLAGQMHWGTAGTIIALLVAPAKAALVLLYFMHLRHEKPLFAAMFLFTVFSLATAIALTFSDYFFR